MKDGCKSEELRKRKLKILQMWLGKADKNGLATWRERIRETGYQHAGIWLLYEMLKKAKRGRMGL